MIGVKILRNIKPEYNKNLILTRLGYDRRYTALEGVAKADFERLVVRTENILDITCAYCVINIKNIESPKVMLEDGTVLSGVKLSDLLKSCDQALFMLATGGRRVMALIRGLQEEGRMSEAVVVDAAASEITDSALDLVMAQVEQQLRSKGRTLTKMRFSPGYGDFDITQQRDFYRILQAELFGIEINDAYLLIPEKSVFAIAGIGGA